jgi:methanogenic corrinoid protein MtbC1
MEEVVNEIKKENLMDKVKIIIGGRSVTEAFAKKIGVVYGKDGIDGLNKCLALIGD